MATTPQYGGTSGVEELDLGQTGSDRRAANQANFTLQVTIDEDPPRMVPQEMPQSSIRFEEHLGPAGAKVTWVGTLKVDSAATLTAIRAELQRYKDGYNRTNGVATTMDESYLQPTTLKDGLGETVSTRARLLDFEFGRTHRITSGGSFNYLTTLRVTFQV